MLYGTQKWFDWDKDGKLSPYEWEQWDDCMNSGHAQPTQQAAIVADFLDDVNKMLCWMRADLAHLEGEREDQASRVMHLALHVISSALQTQTIGDHLRLLLRAFWQDFQPMLGESVYQALCAKQLLFEDLCAIRADRPGTFWQSLLDDLPPERRVGKDADLQELLDDTSRLYNYFRNPAAPEIDYAAALEPHWAKYRLPERSETKCDEEYEEEPDEDAEAAPDSDESSASEKAPTAADAPLYTFCTVHFRDTATPYTYLTGGLDLAPGDFVVVPVRRKNRELLARVTDVFTCTAQTAPYPPKQAKTVLRKTAQTAFPEKAPAQTPPPKPAPAKPTPAPAKPAPPKPVPAPPPQPAAKPQREQPDAPAKPAPVQPAAKRPAPPKKQRRFPWGWLIAAAAAAAFVCFAIPALERSEADSYQQPAARQTTAAAKPDAAGQPARAPAAQPQSQSPEKQYSGKLPKAGMPVRYLKYTTLGEPDERLNCKNFEKLDTNQQYFNVYWYDAAGEMIAAGMCAQWKDDSEFMLKTFTKYAPATHTAPSSGSIRDDYDSPEDLYEDNPWDYEDEDEAWDEWEND